MIDALLYKPGVARWSRDEVVARLARALPVSVEEAYLFGSYARGEATADSDVDLIVVMPTTERWPNRAAKLFSALAELGATDVLVYTPAEWMDMKTSHHPFVAAVAGEWVKVR